MLERGGVDAVLDEVEAIRSDHVQGIYLSSLLDQASPSAADTERIIAVAAAGMSSEHELAELLVALAGRGLDAPLDSRYLELVASFGSDHEAARALRALLESAAPPATTVAGVLAVAAGLESSHELSRVARAALAAIPPSAAVPGVFFDTVAAIPSSHGRRRALEAVVERELAEAEIARLLEVAATISSDHDRAEILVDLANRHRLDDANRRRYRDAAGGISSRHDRERALTALERRGP